MNQSLQNGPFIANALDLILTVDKGTCGNAFFFNNKMDNVPYFNSDKPTVINSGELIKKIEDGN